MSKQNIGFTTFAILISKTNIGFIAFAIGIHEKQIWTEGIILIQRMRLEETNGIRLRIYAWSELL